MYRFARSALITLAAVSALALAQPSQAQLGPFGTQFWRLGLPGLDGPLQGNAQAGEALAAGDFNGDGCAELAVGIPFESLFGLPGGPECGEQLGLALAAGRFNDGAVSVIDLVGGGASVWITQDLLGPDPPEANDRFASALAAADFNNDGRDDLVIGVPSEDLGVLVNAGVIHVIPAGEGGLDLDSAKLWFQTIDPSDSNDLFGFALAPGRFAGNHGFDLAIGAPWEQVGGAVAAGGWNLLYSQALFADGFESGDLSGWDLVVP